MRLKIYFDFNWTLIKLNELNCLQISRELVILGKQISLIILLGLYSISKLKFDLSWQDRKRHPALTLTSTLNENSALLMKFIFHRDSVPFCHDNGPFYHSLNVSELFTLSLKNSLPKNLRTCKIVLVAKWPENSRNCLPAPELSFCKKSTCILRLLNWFCHWFSDS